MTDDPRMTEPFTLEELEQIRAEWREHPWWYSYAAGRWLATLDAVLQTSPDSRLGEVLEVSLVHTDAGPGEMDRYGAWGISAVGSAVGPDPDSTD